MLSLLKHWLRPIPPSFSQFGSSSYLTGNMAWKRKAGIIVEMGMRLP